MPLILPGNVASATAAVGFSVANSCRFNNGDSTFMHKTLGTPTSTKIGTISMWFKLGVIGTARALMTSWSDANNHASVLLNGDNQLDIFQYNSGYSSQLKPNALFRDVGSWYHLCFQCGFV